jgi:hypothetical protein
VIAHQYTKGNVVTVLYHDYHGEYTPEGFHTLINFFNLMEALSESPRAYEAARKAALAIGYDSELDPFGLLIGYRGTRGHIDDRFHKHILTWADGPTGADDDHFDYWPEAVELSYSMATDLDELYQNNAIRRERVAREFNEVYDKQEDWMKQEWATTHEKVNSHRPDPS